MRIFFLSICILLISQMALGFELPMTPVKFNRHSMGGAFAATATGSIRVPQAARVDLDSVRFLTSSGQVAPQLMNQRLEGQDVVVDFSVVLDSYSNMSQESREIFSLILQQPKTLLLAAVNSERQLHFSIASSFRQLAALTMVPENPVVHVLEGLIQGDNPQVDAYLKQNLPSMTQFFVKNQGLGIDSIHPSLSANPFLSDMAKSVAISGVKTPRVELGDGSSGYFQKIFKVKNLDPGSIISFYIPGRGWSSNILVNSSEAQVYLDGEYLYSESHEVLVRASQQISAGHWGNSAPSALVQFQGPSQRQPGALTLEPNSNQDGILISNIQPGNQVIISELADINFMMIQTSSETANLTTSSFSDGVYKALQVNPQGFVSRSSNSISVISGQALN